MRIIKMTSSLSQAIHRFLRSRKLPVTSFCFYCTGSSAILSCSITSPVPDALKKETPRL